MVKFAGTLFFGDNSYLQLNKKQYNAYLKVKNACLELLKERKRFKMNDLRRKLKIREQNIPQHTIVLLATASEIRGEKPLIRIQTTPNNQPHKKMTITRWISLL